MAIIPSYPSPSLPLSGNELLAGFSGGATRAVPASALAALALSSLTSDQLVTIFGFVPYSSGNPANYVTASGARAAVSSGGNITYNAATGAFSLTVGNVTGALGFSPYSAANPAGYTTAAAVTAAITTALNAILSGQARFTLPDEANGDPIPAPGSGLFYLSGDFVKCA